MSPSLLRLPERSPIPELARAVARAGGRLVIVGGWVRDRLLGEASNDLDVEIFGLSSAAIEALLRPLGFSAPVGRHFPVWRDTRAGIDVGLPRAGAGLYSSAEPSSLEAAYREASRHRDLTINAIGFDPLEGSDARALIDPWQGRADLAARRLRAVDVATFGSDPIRVLRVARQKVCLAARVDPELADACRRIAFDTVAVERIGHELRRILDECPRPSEAFDFLVEVDQLEVFPPLAALRGVPQDPFFHPEGDVYVHTGMVVDRAVEIGLRLDPDSRETLLLAALCHDLGKPETTSIEGDRVRSLGHEVRSAELAREWLAALRLPERRIRAVETLVSHHLAPAELVRQGAGPRAYRRLARKLAAGGVDLVDLERLARADHLGRTTADAGLGRFEAGRRFLEAARAAGVGEGVRPDVVSAAQLMERGIVAGPELGRLLARCREIQDETGLRDASRIVDRVLAEARKA